MERIPGYPSWAPKTACGCGEDKGRECDCNESGRPFDIDGTPTAAWGPMVGDAPDLPNKNDSRAVENIEHAGPLDSLYMGSSIPTTSQNPLKKAAIALAWFGQNAPKGNDPASAIVRMGLSNSVLRPYLDILPTPCERSANEWSGACLAFEQEEPDSKCMFYALSYWNIYTMTGIDIKEWRDNPLLPDIMQGLIDGIAAAVADAIEKEVAEALRNQGLLPEGKSYSEAFPNGLDYSQRGIIYDAKRRVMNRLFGPFDDPLIRPRDAGAEEGVVEWGSSPFTGVGDCPDCGEQFVMTLWIRVGTSKEWNLHTVSCVYVCKDPVVHHCAVARVHVLECWDHPRQGGYAYDLMVRRSDGYVTGNRTTPGAGGDVSSVVGWATRVLQ